MEACQNHEMLAILVIGLSSLKITLDETLEPLVAETVQEKKEKPNHQGKIV